MPLKLYCLNLLRRQRTTSTNFGFTATSLRQMCLSLPLPRFLILRYSIPFFRRRYGWNGAKHFSSISVREDPVFQHKKANHTVRSAISPHLQLTPLGKRRHDDWFLGGALQHQLVFCALAYRAAVEISSDATRYPRVLQNLEIRLQGHDPQPLIESVDDLRQEFHLLLEKAMADPTGPNFGPEVLAAIGLYVRAEVSLTTDDIQCPS